MKSLEDLVSLRFVKVLAVELKLTIRVKIFQINLSVDHPDKILEMGNSLDVSRCQAKKNDGSGCTNLVRFKVSIIFLRIKS